MKPEVSVVIPVYNESSILDSAIPRFLDALEAMGQSFELILVENGSTDNSADKVQAWQLRDERVVAMHCHSPNYGAALLLGLLKARATYVICEEIDLGANLFWRQALAKLEHQDLALVVGSKAMPGSADMRPWLRQVATRSYNGLLRALFGYQGTDTHGVKVLNKERLAPVIAACKTEHDVFASELVIRVQRSGQPWAELPIRIQESRPTSIAVHRRIPRVLGQLARLALAIYGPGSGDASTKAKGPSS